MMRVSQLVKTAGTTAFSFEILPPLKGNSIDKVFRDIDRLREFNPRYINITTHSSECVYRDMGGGVYRCGRLRRRPGTVAVAAAVQSKYGIPVVPHILCSGFTKEETEYVLIDLQFLGIYDLLLLRGDKVRHEPAFMPEEGGNAHATDLIAQVNDFNRGIFVDGSPIKQPGTPFSYGVACYPEKHEESPNIESDIYWLKQKVVAGAEYAVTQLFYDNARYFDFVRRVRAEGIDIPIIPGIKPVSKLSQLSVVPRTFKVDIPPALSSELVRCKTDADAARVGVEWCVAQCRELMKAGVPSIHFYSYSAIDSVYDVARQIY